MSRQGPPCSLARDTVQSRDYHVLITLRDRCLVTVARIQLPGKARFKGVKLEIQNVDGTALVLIVRNKCSEQTMQMVVFNFF